MRCPRCGRSAAAASWYCAHCGAELSGVNVADSVAVGPLPALRRWLRLASITLVVALSIVAMGALAARRGGSRWWTGNVDKAATATVQWHTSGTASALAATRDMHEAITPTPRAQRIVTAPWPASRKPTPRARPDGPIWRAARLVEPPVLDGLFHDWAGATEEISSVLFGQTFWRGAEDLGARAHIGWTDRALYLAITVTDDFFSQPSTGERLYLGDSLEIQLDTDLEGDWDDATYSDDDWQIGVSPGDFAGREPEVYVWRPALGALTEVVVASRRLESGFAVELELPWELLRLDLTGPRSLGLALNVSDNDDPLPAQLTMISSAPARSWSDPRTFGTLFLDDGGPGD